MTQAAALHSFFNSFGVPAYPVTAVPDNAEFPRMAYDSPVSSWSGQPVSISVYLYYKSESEKLINDKALEILSALKNGGTQVSCDDGTIWLTPGDPFCTSIPQETDNTIKGRFFNITRIDNTF